MPDVTADTPVAARPADGKSLAAYTTLRLGGPADRLVIASNEDEIIRSVRAVPAPLLVLAGGSNVVVGDRGVPGTVLLIRTRGITFVPETPEPAAVVAGQSADLPVGGVGDLPTRAAADLPAGGVGDLPAELPAEPPVVVSAAAGEPWDEVVAAAVREGLSGLECLSGIPGSAGATPIQNVGAYGQEVAETITAVRVFDRTTDEVRVMSAAECGFAYRTSVFKHSGRWVVLSVDFRLRRSPLSAPVRYAELARSLGVPVGGRVPLDEARAAVLKLRAGKGMVLDPDDPDTYSAGSFFTNPILDTAAFAALRDRARSAGLGEPPAWPGTGGLVKVSAAWLIERSGFARGYAIAGGVGLSTKHTLALTNRGSGSTDALLALAREIRDGVHARFGVTLHPEPVLVGCEL